MMLGLSSCATTDSKSLSESATLIGKLRATSHLPPAPNYCREEVPHADVNRDDPWGTTDAEGLQLNSANQKIRLCMGKGGFYDRVVSSQEKATK